MRPDRDSPVVAGASLDVLFRDEAETAALAAEVAAYAVPGDLILLDGELGAGKSAFARAFIRAAAGDSSIDVPSPTFTLIQTYAGQRFEIAHLDLYRIAGEGELDELGLDEARGGVLLVEWPDRAPALWHEEALSVALTLDPADPGARRIVLSGAGPWAGRIARLAEIRDFLTRSGFSGRVRSYMQGDASTRRYERLSGGAILMDAPARPDPGSGGAPAYSRIAHLAEDVVPFLAIARSLKERGFSAPEILAADPGRGFVILEDLGGESVIDAGRRPIPERYERAVDSLAALHGLDMPEEAGGGEVRHRLPRYDMEAFMAEVSLLPEWYVPRALGAGLPQSAEADYAAIWRELLAPMTELARHRTWVLRDYHSPNLIWLPERAGIARIGIIDFQDALIGPCTYDLASLTMDARVDVPAGLGERLAARYIAARQAADGGFDAEGFRRDLAVMAAQRNCKILGIFARLASRDGKPNYLAHLPRIRSYLEHALTHPTLAPLKLWCEAHLPGRER